MQDIIKLSVFRNLIDYKNLQVNQKIKKQLQLIMKPARKQSISINSRTKKPRETIVALLDIIVDPIYIGSTYLSRSTIGESRQN